MLFKSFIGLSLFSVGLFIVTSVTGAKGPTFSSGASAASGGRGSRGYIPIWHGGK